RRPHRSATAKTREKPWRSSRLASPETGTYSPWGKFRTTWPVRASTPTMRCANEPAYATPFTTTAAPETGPPSGTDHRVAPVAAERPADHTPPQPGDTR